VESLFKDGVNPVSLKLIIINIKVFH
jgi:hypothetical protein